MQVWLYTFISITIISAISLIGIFTLSLKTEFLKRILHYMVSFAVGALFGDALIHLIPEAFEKLGANMTTSLCIAGGIMIFFVLEKFLRWQHCHIPTSKEHTHPVVALNLIGDAVHNLIDGMIVAASFSVSPQIGFATTLAVILHEIPQEIGDFGILIHGGMTVKKALFFNFLSALTAFLGAFIFLALGPQMSHLKDYLIPITAGGFLYIAGSDLIPELHHGGDDRPSTSFKQFVMIVLGLTTMALLTFLE